MRRTRGDVVHGRKVSKVHAEHDSLHETAAVGKIKPNAAPGMMKVKKMGGKKY
jgi:hypothetical protein